MYDTILVGVDGGEGGEAALGHAIELATAVGATVHALVVIDTHDHPLRFSVDEVVELDQTATELVEKLISSVEQVDIEGEVRRGNPTDVLQLYADEVDADLLVVGKRGSRGLEDAILGSTTDRLVRLSDRPVTVVPTDQHSETTH